MEKNNNALNETIEGGSIIFIGLVLSYLSSFIFQIIVAKYLTINDFGLLSIGILIMNFGLIFGSIGLPSAAKRFVAYHLSKKDISKAKGTVIICYSISFITSVIVSITLFLLSDYISLIIFNNSSLIPILKIFSISIPFISITTITSDILLGLKKTINYIIINTFLDKILRIILVLLIIIIGGSLLELSLAYLLGILITAVISFVMIYYIFLKKIKNKATYNIKEVLFFSLPLFLSTAASIIMVRIDQTIIGVMLTPSDVAIYSVCFSFAALLEVVFFSLTSLYIPLVSEMLGKKEKEKIPKLYNSIRRISFIGTLPIFIAILIYSKNIITILYGENYSTGWSTMLVLCSGVMISLLFGPVGPTLQAFKKTNLLFYSILFAMVTNIILNIIFVPIFGIIGAAISTKLSILFRQLFFIKGLNKTIKIKLTNNGIIKSILISLIVIAIFFPLKFIFTYNNFIILFISCFGILLLYSILLLKLNCLNKEDKGLIKTLAAKMKINEKIMNKILNI